MTYTRHAARGLARVPFAVEPLERRMLLSGSSPTDAQLLAEGFVPVDWDGQVVFARADRAIVQFDGLSGSARQQVNAAATRLGKAKTGLKALEHLGGDGLVLVEMPKGTTLGQLRAKVKGAGVRSVEPDVAQWELAATPSNGPINAEQWGLNNTGQTIRNAIGGRPDSDVDAPEAWDYTTGKAGATGLAGVTAPTGVTVAVIDSGVDYTHPDLYLNIWINPGEIPSAIKANLRQDPADPDSRITFHDLNWRDAGGNLLNGAYVRDGTTDNNTYVDAGDLLNDSRWENRADEERNGKVDDLIGWNFVGGNNDPKPVTDHGTHVAGTIAADGASGSGVYGVAPGVLIMPLGVMKAGALGATTSSSYTSAAVRYAADGAQVSNNSYGGGGGRANDALDKAIAYAATKNQLFVAAAGNSGANNDAASARNKVYPASYNRPNIVSVAAVDSADRLAFFSNYGATTVDIAAPGETVYSTVPTTAQGESPKYKSGTSMAAPHVAASAALAFSVLPANTPYATVRDKIYETRDPVPGLAGKMQYAGRVNAHNLVQSLLPAAGLHAAPTLLFAAGTGRPGVDRRVTLAWGDNNHNEGGFEVERSTDPGFAAGAVISLGRVPAAKAAPTDNDAATNDTFATFNDADPALADGTVYYYRVRAYRANPGASDTVSEWTNTAAARPLSADSGLVADYYDDRAANWYEYWTTHVATQVDPDVDFNWGNGAPSDPGQDPTLPATVTADYFSVKWSGYIQPNYSEAYTLSAQVDDAVKLWLEDDAGQLQLVFDPVLGANTSEHSRDTRVLQAGRRYKLLMEYAENDGEARARLMWSSASQLKEAVPSSQLYTGPAPQPEPTGTADTGGTGFFSATAISGTDEDAEADRIIDTVVV